MITAKQLKGFKKVKQQEKSGILEGITFNDSYNLSKFGITKNDFYDIQKKVNEIFGIIPPCMSEITLKVLNR